jgi:hypothetical protein
MADSAVEIPEGVVMRIWNVDPRTMCAQHLLGEHVELHMIVGAINKGKSLEGFYSAGLIDTRVIVARHEQLVAEMIARGMKHKSPLPAFVNPERGYVTPLADLELRNRCSLCRERTL